MASVWVATYDGKRDGLAAALKEKLKYGDEVDLSPTVSRYLNFDLTKSQHLAPMRLVFWEGVVCGDYPLHFLRWWEDAYSAYDLVDSTKREKAEIRTLLAEAKFLFEGASNAAYPRYGAARELLLGFAIAVERQTLGADDKRIEKGLKHLEAAITQFRTLKPDQTALSTSDHFHIASAVHMTDWLLSELSAADAQERRQSTLKRLAQLGAIKSYTWLANVTGNWVYAYNVAEIYGRLGHPDLEQATLQAIKLNPRLADFDASTEFDGVDEPLRNAPALKDVLPKLSEKYGDWLKERAAAYHQHLSTYREDVTKGLKAMLKQVGRKLPSGLTMQRITKVFSLLTGFAVGLYVYLDAIAAIAKPIF
jgi:hypothetical protein